MGRWSDGSTSRPSCEMILVPPSVLVGLPLRLGLRASNESGPNGMLPEVKPGLVESGGAGLTDLRPMRLWGGIGLGKGLGLGLGIGLGVRPRARLLAGPGLCESYTGDRPSKELGVYGLGDGPRSWR
jgi:hypothetical protein